MREVLILYGVSGCGKTTVGQTLARQTGRRFVDADDHHSKANVEKMKNGEPLSDNDRLPWLLKLHKILCDSEEDLVMACSALKRKYRSIIVCGVCSPFIDDSNRPTTCRDFESELCNWSVMNRVACENHSWFVATFVLLHGNEELIGARLTSRVGHFMPPGLLSSQFEILENVENADEQINANHIAVDTEGIVSDVVKAILSKL